VSYVARVTAVTHVAGVVAFTTRGLTAARHIDHGSRANTATRRANPSAATPALVLSFSKATQKQSNQTN
jgi:hypothetical protein